MLRFCRSIAIPFDTSVAVRVDLYAGQKYLDVAAKNVVHALNQEQVISELHAHAGLDVDGLARPADGNEIGGLRGKRVIRERFLEGPAVRVLDLGASYPNRGPCGHGLAGRVSRAAGLLDLNLVAEFAGIEEERIFCHVRPGSRRGFCRGDS